MRPARVEVHIEELVLHGLAPGDRYRVAEAIEAELGRLLAGADLPSWLTAGGEIGRFDGGAFSVTAGSRPETVGRQVARALHRGLGGLTGRGESPARPTKGG